MNELISVIIPVYNVEKTLEKCVDSVLSSTYENLEIILVDDGTKDSSGEICDRYGEAYPDMIRVIHKENGGLSSARNAGLEIAAGDYLAFVDSDDAITADMLQYLYDLMHERKADVAICSYARNEKQLDLGKENETVREYAGEKEIMDLFFRVNGGISFFSVCGRLYKSDKVKDIRFLEGFINEDEYYTYEVYKKSGKLAVSDLKKYYYYVNRAGITRNKLNNRDKNLLQIWDMIVAEEKGQPHEDAAILNRKRSAFTLCSKALLFGKDKDLDPEFYRQLKREVRENRRLLKESGVLDFKRKILLEAVSRF